VEALAMKNAIRQLISRPALQPAWIHLLKLCHAGMNCGGGQSVRHSGELGALDFVLRSVPASRPFVLFDVGANDGEYLQAALERIDRDVRAYSFEPQSSSFDILRARFERDPRVSLFHTAVGSETGSAELFLEGGGSVSSLHRSENSAPGRSETVQVTTIDRLCAENAIQTIDLLKIDTEGHEIDVLAGAAETLRADRIFAVQVEFGDTFLHTKYHFRDLFDLLSPRYRLYRILRGGLYEVGQYTHDLEIYKLSNYLGIHR
jgi:FkbM family methyltransferase